MDRQIVDLDPGKNYNPAISAVVQIVARLQIVMLDDTVLLRKSLVRFR